MKYADEYFNMILESKKEIIKEAVEEAKMCEHHADEEFPKEVLDVPVEEVLDLMKAQTDVSDDEDLKDLYEEFESWLKDNASKLSEAGEEGEDKEDGEDEASEENEGSEEAEDSKEKDEEVKENYGAKMDEASQELPYRITKRIPGKLLRINFTSDWGGENETLIFNSDKEGIPVKEFMTTNYEWTEDGDEVKMASMKGGQLVGNTPASTKIIEDLKRTFGNIDKVYVRQITEG